MIAARKVWGWPFGAALALLCLLGQMPPVVHEVPAPPAIAEDDPRWDCRTMGNKVCGNSLTGAEAHGKVNP